MKKQLLSLAAVSLFAFSAQASDVPYSFVELSYNNGEVSEDGIDLDIDGIGFDGSYDFGNNIVAFAGLKSLQADILGSTLDLDFSRLGVGYHYPVSDVVDIVPFLSYVSADLAGTDDSSVGYGVSLRGMAASNLELYATVESTDLFDDSDTGFDIGGYYYLDNGVGFGASYVSQFDIDGYAIKLRYKF